MPPPAAASRPQSWGGEGSRGRAWPELMARSGGVAVCTGFRSRLVAALYPTQRFSRSDWASGNPDMSNAAGADCTEMWKVLFALLSGAPMFWFEGNSTTPLLLDVMRTCL